MSKPFTDDQDDVPPEPSPLDDDLPPPPPDFDVEVSLRSDSRSAVAVASPPVSVVPLAEQLLGSAEEAVGPAIRADGDILSVAGARYRLTKRIGAGGMGEVFLARKLGSSGFERDVALKTVLPTLAGHKKASAFLKGFVDEARLAAMLHHPNICQVFDLQPLEGRGLIQVLEYIPGHSLKAIIDAARKKHANLTEPFACFVISEVAAALDYAHNATGSDGRPLGIVHRDVTPHNVMVSTSGNVKLLDFGIAFSALNNREATTSNMVKGKDQYYAPEQLIGAPLDGRSDQFALALCLYEMLVLKRFFAKTSTDTDTALHLRIAQLTPESVEGTLASAQIDESLKRILHHALAPSRDERFPSCAEFGDALQSFSQRRGWLYKPSDARKELEALFALEDSPDAEKTNPSGKRAYSVAPRKVAAKTMQLPPLTPGRTAMTPPSPPDDSVVRPAMPTAPKRTEASASVARSASRAQALPVIEPASDDASADHQDASASLKPSATAMRRRTQLQEDLHNPKTSAKKMLAVPAIVLVCTLLIGVAVVKILLMSAENRQSEIPVEVVKTPDQLRAEREAEARALAPSGEAPPELAPAPSPVAPSPLEVQPQTPPLTVSTGPRAQRKPGKDSKAVDALLAQQYGGVRPTVGADGNAVAPATPSGPRRRSLDTVMTGEMPAPGTVAAFHLPKGTMMAARLTSPADSAQPSPVMAVLTADVSVGGAVVISKGAKVICTTVPAGPRLGLSCDTLQSGHQSLNIDAIALASDKRVGFPLPRAAVTSDGSAGDTAKEGALNLGRSLLNRVAPEGAAGDLTNGAADTAGNLARGARAAAPEGPAPMIPAGTNFVLFVQSSVQQ